jgi:hypothetical protein
MPCSLPQSLYSFQTSYHHSLSLPPTVQQGPHSHVRLPFSPPYFFLQHSCFLSIRARQVYILGVLTIRPQRIYHRRAQPGCCTASLPPRPCYFPFFRQHLHFFHSLVRLQTPRFRYSLRLSYRYSHRYIFFPLVSSANF